MSAAIAGAARPFGIVVFGATGFTGKLICERLAQRAAAEGIAWAMAGRDPDKLAAVHRDLDCDASVAMIRADSADTASIDAMAGQARLVIAAAGPYQLYGTPVVEACARHGTDYVDLSGEVLWMREMIDRFTAAAQSSGARILFSCGFDSVPFELGVSVLQDRMAERFGHPTRHVSGRVRSFVGRFSGGTAASGRATRRALADDAAALALLAEPHMLVPGFAGSGQAEISAPTFDADLAEWTAPFVLSPINVRNIHRSNALRGYAWGRDFAYDEGMLTGPGEAGRAKAEAIAGTNPLGADAAAQPGEGPSQAERDAGWYDLVFAGRAQTGERLAVSVTGDRDPGYGSTARIVTEVAICLLNEGQGVRGGIWTPGAALGSALVKPLVQHAGLTFGLVDQGTRQPV